MPRSLLWVSSCSQIAELAALESLASPSSVEKEKAELAMMKAALQESLGKVCAGKLVSIAFCLIAERGFAR